MNTVNGFTKIAIHIEGHKDCKEETLESLKQREIDMRSRPMNE